MRARAGETIARYQLAPGAHARLPEVELWGAVLWQVVLDLVGSDVAARVEAERWIGPWPGRAFVSVCDLAGIEAEPAHAWLSRIAAMPPGERRMQVADLVGHARGAAARWGRYYAEQDMRHARGA